MKILVTSTWFPTKNNPYNGDFVQRFAQSLSKKATVTLLHVESHEKCTKKEVITTVFNEEYKEIVVYIPAIKPKILNTFRRMLEYQKQAKSLGKFDFTHGNVMYSDSLWLVFRKWFNHNSYFITEHFTNYDSKSGFVLPFWQKYVAKLVAKNAACVFPVSKSLQLGMEENGIDANYKVIPNIVNTNVFKPNLQNKNENNIVQFLHVSSLNDDQKNISGILQACKKVAEDEIPFQLTLIGEDKHDIWKNYIVENQLNEKISILGQLSHGEVAQYMQQSDCLLMFSHYETHCIVVYEALACGNYIITSDLEVFREYIPNQYVTYAKSNDEADLAKKIKDFILNKPQINPTHAYKFVVNAFSEEVIMNQYLDSYKELAT